MLTKYKPSGAFTGKTLAGAPLVLLGAAILGVVYQAVMHWIPLIFLEALAVVFMCVLTGGLVGILTRKTHCRNRVAGAAVGLAAGVVAVAVSHFVEYRLSRPAIVASAPQDIRAAVDANLTFLDYCQLRVEAGWTFGKVGQSSSSKPTVSGVFVYIFWAAEALLLIGAGAVGGYTSASKPYCEPCSAWADFDMLKVEVPEPSAETAAAATSAMTVQQLIPPKAAMIPPPPPPVPDDPKEAKKQAKAPRTASCLLYSVTSCPTCKMLHTLKVEHISVTTRGGKNEKKTKLLHDSVVMTSEEVGRLAELNAPPPMAATH
ncbi:MAG TPA: hypothetical protein VFF65_13210 [Phycisphaerales bacterium]|nr:hypothetical protein [Phycisphaerales bacterium]